MILIFPFSMRESVNYAIRAKLRGEKVVGATSGSFTDAGCCDEYVILPTIFEDTFEERLKAAIETFGITRFYTPHHLVYAHVKSLGLPLEFAEGNPIEIMEQEFRYAARSGPPDLIMQASRIYGHMSEEKLMGIVRCFRKAPIGDVLEIGHAWGKSLKMLTMLTTGVVYAIDPCSQQAAVQKEAHPLVSTQNIDWELMGEICRANVPEAVYGKVPDKVAVLHIDGNHDYENVCRDWQLYGHLIVKGGWLILDDIDWSGVAKLWNTIKHEFDEVYEAGGALFGRKK